MLRSRKPRLVGGASKAGTSSAPKGGNCLGTRGRPHKARIWTSSCPTGATLFGGAEFCDPECMRPTCSAPRTSVPLRTHATVAPIVVRALQG